jgi:hypothetical protein
MMKQYGLLVVVLTLAVVILIVPVTAGPATQIAVYAGNSQSATVSTAVTNLPSVIVKDASNNPVSGVRVIFAVANGGGSITGGTATTGTNGVATVGSWILGTTAGTNTLTATNGTLLGSPVTFTATGTAGPATQIAINAGNSQSATVGTAVTNLPSVIVKDTYNNPKSGVAVIFAADSGSGSVTGGSATTGTNGVATVGSWILGTTAGTNTLTATCGSLTPVTFTATGTAISGPTISSISPSNGFNTTSVSITNLAGSSFVTSGTTSVSLTRAGHASINATGTVVSSTQITCTLPITGAEAGAWNVVVTNPDGQTATLPSGFTVKSQADAPTLTSIDKSSGEVNTTVSINSLAGTNFASTASIKLVNPYYNDIIGSVSSVNSAGTVISGTFNLNNQVPGNYQVCVFNSANTYICGLSFRILSPGETTATNSSIYFQTNPSGATIWLNRTKVGTSTFTYYNATPGTSLVLVQKAGYKDYTGYVTVLEGKRVTFYAALTPIGEDTTEATTVATTTKKTVTTTKKSTLKVPTTWPSATPTEAPVDPVLALGAAVVGAIIIVMRRQ